MSGAATMMALAKEFVSRSVRSVLSMIVRLEKGRLGNIYSINVISKKFLGIY